MSLFLYGQGILICINFSRHMRDTTEATKQNITLTCAYMHNWYMFMIKFRLLKLYPISHLDHSEGVYNDKTKKQVCYMHT